MVILLITIWMKRQHYRGLEMFTQSRVKSPSEHLSFEFLRSLQANNYVTDSGKEYCKEEVDELVNIKRNRKGAELDNAFKIPKKTLKQKFIDEQLKDLDVLGNSQAYCLVYENALAASETLTKSELRTYIEEYVDMLPCNMFT